MGLLYSILLTTLGCTQSPGSELGLDVREEATGVLALRALDPDDAITSRADGLYSLHSQQLLDPTLSPVVSVARFGEQVVATQGELLVGDQGLLPSPLENSLPGPVTDLTSAGSMLWLKSDGEWWLYAREQLSHPMVDGAPLTGPLVHAYLEGVSVVWVPVDAGLIALADSISGPTVVVRSDLHPTAVTSSSEGVWAATEKQLHLFDGTRWKKVGPSPLQMAGHPSAPGVWIEDARGLRHQRYERGLQTTPVDDLQGSWQGCDADGRLWTLDAAGTVRRAAISPVARLSGLLPEVELSQPQTVRVDVTHADALESVEVLVDGLPQLITTTEGEQTVLLDPVLLGEGFHEVVVHATWTDTEVTSAPLSFTSVVSGPITWVDHVEPLYRSRCSICHDNGTETILIGKNEWIDKIEQILIETEAQRMPIGSAPLDPASIGVIRSWQAAGFP